MEDERPSEQVNEEKSQEGGERPSELDLDQGRKRTASKLSSSGGEWAHLVVCNVQSRRA